MKSSNFRIKIIAHKFKNSIPGLVASLLILAFVDYAFKRNIIFYFFYPFVYAGTLANLNYSGLKAVHLASQLIYTFSIVVFSWRFFPPIPIEYLACPCCREDVDTFYNWGCESCGKRQPKAAYITDRCTVCRNFMSTFICGKCGKEFLL